MSEQTDEHRSDHAGHSEEPGQHDRKQQRTTTFGLIAVGVLLVVGMVAVVVRYQQTPGTSVYPVIDAIPCQRTVARAIHFHAHVSLYISGKRISIPAQVGIVPDETCQYWIHTHDTSGVLHIESPAGISVTLGSFLDIWGQQFRQREYPRQLSDPAGWQVFLNGQPFTGDVHTIVLHSHMLMTLAYHSPGVHPDTTYQWDNL
jgi:hypothetical protein